LLLKSYEKFESDRIIIGKHLNLGVSLTKSTCQKKSIAIQIVHIISNVQKFPLRQEPANFPGNQAMKKVGFFAKKRALLNCWLLTT